MSTIDEEHEADEFAAAILMPEAMFRDTAMLHSGAAGYDLTAIARHFGVTVRAATMRGRRLGMFAWGE